MLQRLAKAAPLDHLAEALDLRRRQRLLEIQVELHPRPLEQMSQQQLRLEPRRVHAFPSQEFGAALDGFQNRHTANLKGTRRRSSMGVRILGFSKIVTTG